MLTCILKRRLFNVTTINRSLFRRSFASKSVDLEESDRPVKFSTSPASRLKAGLSTRGELDSRLWYEPHVILASIGCFLFYFCYWREENDLDETLRTPLYETVHGLEKVQLENFIKHSTDESEEVIQAKKRLRELDPNSQLIK